MFDDTGVLECESDCDTHVGDLVQAKLYSGSNYLGKWILCEEGIRANQADGLTVVIN